MNNGCLIEAVSRIATLDDVEEETFIAFCEFGYKGNNTTPDCKDKEYDGHFDAESSDQLKDNDLQDLELEPELELADTYSSVGNPSFQESAQKEKELLFFTSPEIDVESPYKRWWSQKFCVFLEMWPQFLPTPTFLLMQSYVFATRYLIDPLREQCLKSLHRDLCNFSLNGQSMAYILDLLEYTYEQRGRQEPGGSYSLRMLVIDYISCEARTLVENTRFRYMLDDQGEIASDLVVKLVE